MTCQHYLRVGLEEKVRQLSLNLRSAISEMMIILP